MSCIPRHIEAAIPAGIVRIIDDLYLTPDTPHDRMLEVLKYAFDFRADLIDGGSLYVLTNEIAFLLTCVHRTRVKDYLEKGTPLVGYGPEHRDQPYITVQSLLETVRQVQEGTPLYALFDPIYGNYCRLVTKLGDEVPAPKKMWTSPDDDDDLRLFLMFDGTYRRPVTELGAEVPAPKKMWTSPDDDEYRRLFAILDGVISD